ncbi:U6 snRNA-associated Sm-like protein LSm2 [Echinococcus granulosus]|nr:U6 snRNA-associated Sm-like protein LSm2 [Echinococcus granulosus]
MDNLGSHQQGESHLFYFIGPEAATSVLIFYSFFKTLVGKDVVVELKNDLCIHGTLHSVDQYHNFRLSDITVTDPEKHPYMLPADECDVYELQNASRKEATLGKQQQQQQAT